MHIKNSQVSAISHIEKPRLLGDVLQTQANKENFRSCKMLPSTLPPSKVYSTHTHTSLRFSVTIFVADAMLYTVWAKYGMDMCGTINHIERPSSLLGRDTQLTLASDKVQNLFVSFKHQNLLTLSNNGHFSYLSEITASGPNFTSVKNKLPLILLVIYLLTWKCKRE